MSQQTLSIPQVAEIVTPIQTAITNAQTAILAAIKGISATSSGLTAAQSQQLTTAAGGVAAIETLVNNLSSSVTSLEGKTDGDVQSALSSIASLASSLSSISTTLTGLASAVAALQTAVAQVDTDVKAITLPASPPPPPPPPPQSPPPPPPPPPVSGPPWGSTLEGYDPSIDVHQISTNTNFTAFRESLNPPVVSGGTITMPAGSMGPGDVIEVLPGNPLFSTGELTVVGGGAKATDLTVPNMTKSIIDDIGSSSPSLPLFYGQAGLLPRCQRAHFKNIMLYRCADSLTTGDASSGLRDFAGNTELMTVDGCYFLLNGDGIQTSPNDSNIPAGSRFQNGVWLILTNSVFGDNGVTTDGSSHCAYINGIRVDTNGNIFNNVGHGYCIKSRAPNGTHVNNVLTNANDGGLYDFPQGGVHTIFGGSITNQPGATSKWFIRVGEEGTGVYGLKQPAGQNIIQIGGGCVINFMRSAGNAIQVADGCVLQFDSTCVFNFPTGAGWQDIEQDVSGTGVIQVSGLNGFNLPPIAAPVLPPIPPLGTPLGLPA